MFKRLRRVRLNPTLRELVQEHHLRPSDFIYPLFIRHGEGIKNEVASMPGVYQMSLDVALQECEELLALGLSSIILFGIPETKTASEARRFANMASWPNPFELSKSAFPRCS